MDSSKSLKIIFAGTPEFAATALQALLHSQHKVIAVYTQPDRPAGRGRHLTASPVKKLALKNKIEVRQPLTLRDASEQENLKKLDADVMVVAAYGLLLPLPVLTAPKMGCINIHASLLPRWRGAAPIQRAILAGDTKTGITIMQMDEGLDTGDMLSVVECPILPTDTSQIIHDRLASLGAEALLATLEQLSQGLVKAIPQDNEQATYAHKIKKEEAHLDWNEKAIDLERKVRAFNPWPVAYVINKEQAVRIWKASVLEATTEKHLPGTIVNFDPDDGILIATKQDYLCLLQLQFPGGKVVSASDVWNSSRQDFFVENVLR